MASTQTVSFPYEGRLFKSKDKKFEETILFVPFFNSEQRELARHVRLVNELGYDCLTFTLHKTPAILDFSQGWWTPLKKWREIQDTWKLPISSQMKFGLKHVYADQIENLLNLLPGKKIVYAFSNPGGAAIEALARRLCVDVTGAIFDSGPSGKFVASFLNLCKYEWKLRSPPLRYVIAPLLSYAWSPYLHHDLAKELEAFPKGFKILSIRGWKDLLIPPDHIDAVFEPHPELDWRKLSLPEAGHLRGLRDFREEYVPAVTRFLAEVSTPLPGT